MSLALALTIHNKQTSPSVCYSLTHAHRSIGYRNRNPQPLTESAARLMYLCVYDSRDSSHQSAPSPSVCYSLTHAHSTLPTPTLLTITCTQVLWFLERLTRPTVSCCETTRTRLTVLWCLARLVRTRASGVTMDPDIRLTILSTRVHSQVLSFLLTSFLSLGVPVQRTTECMRGV